MVKKRGFTIVVFLIVLLVGANIFLYTKNKESGYLNLTGKYFESLPDLPGGLNLSVIAFILQWIILLSILFFAYSKFIQHKKHEENLNIDFSAFRSKKTRSKTDLDVLYQIIMDKKSLSVNLIAKGFNITKEKALEWAKILENHELVSIEYPAFSPPEVKVYEKEEPENKKKKEPEKKANKKDKEKKNNKEEVAPKKELPKFKGLTNQEPAFIRENR